jgi:hypothetical protein
MEVIVVDSQGQHFPYKEGTVKIKSDGSLTVSNKWNRQTFAPTRWKSVHREEPPKKNPIGFA